MLWYEKLPWIDVAIEEIGTTEIGGPEHAVKILEYHATTGLKATDDETAWCSSFVNWCFDQVRREGTNSAWSKSWLEWKGGKRVTTPSFGDIVVFDRGGWKGHVGFYMGGNSSLIAVLGGNQGNKVQVSLYSASSVLGYIRPA